MLGKTNVLMMAMTQVKTSALTKTNALPTMKALVKMTSVPVPLFQYKLRRSPPPQVSLAWIALICSLETHLTHVSCVLAVLSTSIPLESRSRPWQAVWDMWLQKYSAKRGTARPSTSGTLGMVPYRSFMMQWNTDYSLQNHYLRAPLRMHAFPVRWCEGARTENDRGEDLLP